MVSFKYSLLILLIAVLDLVRAEDGAYIVARLIQTLIVVVIFVLMGVAIYKCVKKNEKFYNDGDYTTCEYCGLFRKQSNVKVRQSQTLEEPFKSLSAID